MKNKKNSWFALVHVEAINGNQDLGESLGAYVNVLYVASNEKEAISVINDTFNQYDFQVVEIEDLEKVFSLNLDFYKKNREKYNLIKEMKKSTKTFFWGTFYAYEDRDL